MNDLDNFVSDADKKSRFIRFEDGEPVKGIFKGAKLVDDNFNPDEKTMEYSLEIDEVKKTFNSKSVKLARLMKTIEEGKEVEIVKTGTAFNTVWYVEEKKEKG